MLHLLLAVFSKKNKKTNQNKNRKSDSCKDSLLRFVHWGLKSRRILRVVLELPSNLVGFFILILSVGSVGFVEGGGGVLGQGWVGQRVPSLLTPYSRYRGHAKYLSNKAVHVFMTCRDTEGRF